jgi:hypothetical protein
MHVKSTPFHANIHVHLISYHFVFQFLYLIVFMEHACLPTASLLYCQRRRHRYCYYYHYSYLYSYYYSCLVNTKQMTKCDETNKNQIRSKNVNERRLTLLNTLLYSS